MATNRFKRLTHVARLDPFFVHDEHRNFSFNNGDIGNYSLEKLRAMGEVGQLLIGLRAGFKVAEIAKKREWSKETLAKVLVEAYDYVESGKDSK